MKLSKCHECEKMFDFNDMIDAKVDCIEHDEWQELCAECYDLLESQGFILSNNDY